MAVHGADSVEFRVEPQGFRELLNGTREFDKALARTLRRGIRIAAQPAADDAKREALAGSYSTNTGMRQQVAAGIRVQVSTSKARPGVRIVASGAALPAGKKSMPRIWNKARFRHPVFGNRDVFVDQAGHPFFSTAIEKHHAAVTDAVVRAMNEAAQVLNGGNA